MPLDVLRVDTSCLISVYFFIAAYLCFAPFYYTSRQRAWVLTGLSSGLTSLAALPYFCDFVLSGGRVRDIRPATAWSEMVVGMFQGYLIADLVMGSVFYRQHISLMTGWVHHTLYFGLIQYISLAGWSNIFCLALIMEIPTLILALGSLHPRWRSDYLFAGAFFSTRIMLHIGLIIAYARIYLGTAGLENALRGSREFNVASSSQVALASGMTQGIQTTSRSKPLSSPLPTLFFLAAFPMHCIWFTACVRGILRRRVKSAISGSRQDVPIVLVSSFRLRLETFRGQLRLNQEGRERLRARIQAAYGNARERVWRRQVWARRIVGVYVALDAQAQEF